MNRNNQRKLLPTVRIIENDREANSDLESLLVSSVRYDTVFNSQVESHVDAPQSPSPIMGSLIKKNRNSNVYVEQTARCSCHQNIELLNNSLKLITLKLQQYEVKLNICFGKQASINSLIQDSENKYELFSQKQWELDIKMKEHSQVITMLQEHSKLYQKETSEDLMRIKKIMSKLEGKENEKCRESKLLEHKLQKYREQQNAKLNKVIETIEEIGTLQRKIIDDSEVRPQNFLDQSCSFSIPYQIGNSKKFKILRGCTVSHKPTCQSTNISYSRNLESSK